jgi:hypothetical protein
LGADLLLLGHGGGMAHTLWMHAQQAQQRLRRRNTQPAIVLEVSNEKSLELVSSLSSFMLFVCEE